MDFIKMIPVESSSISRVGYDPEKKELYVEFKSGLYLYEGVDKKTYETFLISESKGKFIHQVIKENYKYKKLEKDNK